MFAVVLNKLNSIGFRIERHRKNWKVHDSIFTETVTSTVKIRPNFPVEFPFQLYNSK